MKIEKVNNYIKTREFKNYVKYKTIIDFIVSKIISKWNFTPIPNL